MKYLKAIWSFVGMCLCRRGGLLMVKGSRYETSKWHFKNEIN